MRTEHLRGMKLAATGHGTGDDAGPSDKENALDVKEPIAAKALFPDDDDEFEMEEIGEHGPSHLQELISCYGLRGEPSSRGDDGAPPVVTGEVDQQDEDQVIFTGPLVDLAEGVSSAPVDRAVPEEEVETDDRGAVSGFGGAASSSRPVITDDAPKAFDGQMFPLNEEACYKHGRDLTCPSETMD